MGVCKSRDPQLTIELPSPKEWEKVLARKVSQNRYSVGPKKNRKGIGGLSHGSATRIIVFRDKMQVEAYLGAIAREGKNSLRQPVLIKN